MGVKKLKLSLVLGGLALVLCSGTIDLRNLFNYSKPTIPDVAKELDNNPSTNPMDDKVATLGRVLFYDKVLSSNDKIACASCHHQEFAFGDTSIISSGVNGKTLRHSPRILNNRFIKTKRSGNLSGFFWDQRASTLEELASMPIKDHIEMGFSGEKGDPDFDALITKMQDTKYYPQLFEFAFGDDLINEERLQKALANFLRSIVSFDSKFDEGLAQVSDPLSPFPNFTDDENAGKLLFYKDAEKDNNGNRTGGGLNCGSCHTAINNGFNFNAVGGVDGNNGIIKETDGSTVLDISKSPNLRNILKPNGELITPLFHNASATTFDEMLDHYNNIKSNDQMDARFQNGFGGSDSIKLHITDTERAQITAFFKTLTGKDIFTNEKWSSPFDKDGNLKIVDKNSSIISAKSEPVLSIFPVPSDGNIYIESDVKISEVKILNLEGKTVYQSNFESDKIHINDLQSGTYIITLSLKNRLYYRRVIVR